MKRIFSLTVATGLMAALAAPASASNLITNGSFEVGSYSWDGNGAYSMNTGNTDMPGWTVVNQELHACNVGNLYNMAAQDGIISLDLTGYHDSSPYGGVQQAVSTTIGAQYMLTFYVGSQNDSGYFVGPTSIDAFIDGANVGTYTNSSTGPGQTWVQQSYQFTATNSSTMIALIGSYSQGGYYIGLDNVSVTQSVPEPSGLVMAAGSILGLLGLRRRRKA